MERNNIESAVYIVDIEGDEKAASFAGIPFIYAKYGFGNAVLLDVLITDIRELPECICHMCQSKHNKPERVFEII